MSIKEQVDDAILLAQNKRFLGALTTLMLAVAASSRKIFPEGTKSLENPNKPMSDREAFTLFLGGRIRKLMFGHAEAPDIGNSGITVNFKGKSFDIAYILYKYYRCELVHTGELPKDIEFAPSQPPSGRGGLSISFDVSDKMVLDYGWINLLIQAVALAQCNGSEFGIKHYKLTLKSNIDESKLIQDTVGRIEIKEEPFGIPLEIWKQIALGRFSILKDAVRMIHPQRIRISNDREVIKLFSRLVETGEINGAEIMSLQRFDLTDQNGRLLPKGLEILRQLSEAYDLVEL